MSAPTDRLELRTPWRPLVVSYGVTLVIAALVAWRYPGARLFIVLVGIVTVIGVGLRLRSRVLLTPEGLDVVSVRAWRLPWDQVTAVETRRRGSFGPFRVMVRGSAGSRELLALRGIGGTPDRPQAQADLVESWWRSHGGPPPDPPPAPAPAQPPAPAPPDPPPAP